MDFDFDSIPKTKIIDEIADTPEKLAPFMNKMGFIIGDTFYECKSGLHEDLDDFLWNCLPHDQFDCYLRITGSYSTATHSLSQIYIGIRKQDEDAVLTRSQAIAIRNLLACYDNDYLHSVDDGNSMFLGTFDFEKQAINYLGCSDPEDRATIIDSLPSSEVENFSKYPPRDFLGS